MRALVAAVRAAPGVCEEELRCGEHARTAVRNFRRAGVDRRVAMKLSGHRTESVFERYDIDTDDDLRDAAEKLRLLRCAICTVDADALR